MRRATSRCPRPADAQHAVHAFAHKVHETVAFADMEFDVGIFAPETRQTGHQEMARQPPLHVDAQQALAWRR